MARRRFFRYLCAFAALLPAAHAAPVIEAVEIVAEKHGEADHHGQIRQAVHSGQHPEDDQNQIVGCVGQRVGRAAAEHQVGCEKAGQDGHRADEKVSGFEIGEDEVEQDGDDKAEAAHPGDLSGGQAGDGHLAFTGLIRVLEPGHHRHDGDGRGHAEVGDHFAVVAEPQGDGGVGQAEHHGEDLAKDLALGDEDEGGHADEGGGQSQGMAAAEEEGQRHHRQREQPQAPFEAGQFAERIPCLHTRNLHKK